MNVGRRLKLAIPAALLVLAVVAMISSAVGTGTSRRPLRATHSRTVDRRPTPATALPAPASPPRQLLVAPPTGDMARVARRFLSAWLACTYHQAPCSHLPGSLPAYPAALAQEEGRRALPTPAELAAHPRIESIRVVRSCRRSAIATATYLDGHGGRFQLHLNLVQEPDGWRVFDVAEAAPHIALPRPLTHGPGGC